MLTVLYGIVFAVSVLMIGVYFLVDKRHNAWLLHLFVCVCICDLGYFLLSLSRSLQFALWANRIAYFGNVFLPFYILMMIINLACVPYPKILPRILVAVNSLMWLAVASGGILPVYYKNVSFEIVNGTGMLIKEYGVLHGFYKIFLFAYFAAMIAVVVYAVVKKTVVCVKHCIFLGIVVIGNIAIWLIENGIHAGFEFMSVSYIVTEVLILFLFAISQDYENVNATRLQQETTLSEPVACNVCETQVKVCCLQESQIDELLEKWTNLQLLSQRETEVLRLLLRNKRRKEIADELFVSENTIKKHTSGIFKKLNMKSRAELIAAAIRILEN
ncbi:MAG: hypothetical protein IJC45_07400 [Clostridia bacterium]|nr:hypothetical protein [Clostridia bacterium]